MSIYIDLGEDRPNKIDSSFLKSPYLIRGRVFIVKFTCETGVPLYCALDGASIATILRLDSSSLYIANREKRIAW